MWFENPLGILLLLMKLLVMDQQMALVCPMLDRASWPQYLLQRETKQTLAVPWILYVLWIVPCHQFLADWAIGLAFRLDRCMLFCHRSTSLGMLVVGLLGAPVGILKAALVPFLLASGCASLVTTFCLPDLDQIRPLGA